MKNKVKESMENTPKHSNLTLEQLKNPEKRFKVPKSYFENLENDFSAKIFQSLLPDKNGFTVPQHYFENFETKLIDQLPEFSTKKSKTFTLFIKTLTAVAAVLIIGIVINQLYINPKFTDTDYAQLADYSTSQVSNYELASIYADELETLPVTDFIETSEIENYLQQDIDQVIYYE